MALRLLYSIAILITFIQLVYMQDCPQDVVFIVDRASYIGSSSPPNDLSRNWNLIKTFLTTLAGRMRFGATNTQLATLTFGASSNVAFYLNANAASIPTQLNNLDYTLGGGSNVADAFQVTSSSVLSAANGKRSGAPSICLFLVTYPPSSDPTQQRNQLTANCRLIVLTASQVERVPGLRSTYGSYPSNPGDFYQTTFDQLSSPDLVTQIINSILVACPTTPTLPTTSTTTTTTLPPPTGCSGNTPADVIFVLDSSGSIDAPNFEKMKAFVGSVIRNLNIDSGIIRAGMMTFSDTSQQVFLLNTFTTRGQMLAALNNVTYMPGATNTGAALNYVRTTMLTSASGDRSDAPNIVVMLTDGGSTDRRATNNEAVLLRNTGATILLIGTGNWLYDPELYAIAGYPSSTIRYINDYNNLLAAVPDYAALICQNTKACSSNPCQNGGSCTDVVGGAYVCQCTSGFGGQNCEQTCRGKYDIVFAIDAAWCLSFEDFKKELEFLRSVIIGLGDADIRIGALVYSTVANITFNLGGDSVSANRKLSALRSISTLFSGGETNMAAPIATARDQMFTTAAGDRPDADNILVILTADMSADVNATVRQAVAARNSGMKIVVVAVGNRFSQSELEGTASYPVANNIFNVSDFSSLTGILNRITPTLCNNINECSSNPCQSGGTCTDLLNGYQCACDSTHTGVNCERANSGIMDVVFAIDTSGMSTSVIDFIVSVVQNFEISTTKTRVGALMYSSTSTSVFELNTYTSKQDIMWALKQIAWSGVFSSSTSTNTASALQMLRDVKFTQTNGDRSNVQNFALFFTNINSNVNPSDSVPNAIRTRISSGGIYIISFGIGTYVYLPELVALSSVAGYPVLLADNSQTIFKANRFSDLSNVALLNSYLNAFSGDQSSKCNSNPCMNGGNCLNDVKKFTCQCPADFGGETCSRRCARTYEVAIVLDISGSGDVGRVVDWNINLARQIVLGLPIRPGRLSLGVVTFGNGSSVSFYLNTYNSKDDILNALSFRLATGPNGLQIALQTLTTDFFTSNRGSSGSAPKVAVVITSSDTPSDYSGIVQAAAAARNANIEIYAISLGDGPNMAMITSIASNSTATHVLTGGQTSDIGTIAGNLLTILCQ